LPSVVHDLYKICITLAHTAVDGPAASVFRDRARTFWFAAQFLPARQRPAVTGLYAFARAMDDLVDEPSPERTPADIEAQLNAWRRWVASPRPVPALAPDPRLATLLAPALIDRAVPSAYLLLLLDGVASDLGDAGRAIDSWPSLHTYCIQVAASVGLSMCHVLGVGDDPVALAAAADLGVAMQLTNILRDVGADLAVGRIYLPADELAAAGLGPAALRELAAGDQRGRGAFDALVRAQIARARRYFHRGLGGVRQLPADSRLAILIAGRVYAAILDEIEAADYDVLTRRAATSAWRKLSLAGTSWVQLALPVRRWAAPISSPNLVDSWRG
jgi:phytoene synthase